MGIASRDADLIEPCDEVSLALVVARTLGLRATVIEKVLLAAWEIAGRGETVTPQAVASTLGIDYAEAMCWLSRLEEDGYTPPTTVRKKSSEHHRERAPEPDEIRARAEAEKARGIREYSEAHRAMLERNRAKKRESHDRAKARRGRAD